MLGIGTGAFAQKLYPKGNKKGDPKIAQVFRGGPEILFAKANPYPGAVHPRVTDSGGFETDLG